ncbi:MAG TPA: acylphosphatase [Victivallales bacterium]|nr:acylphosphatase [Victivallales bacterium]
MKKKAFLINIRGRVTGVGFRWATLDKSEDFSTISGYVRNLARGEVEVFIQGEEGEVDAMADWLKSGPPLAVVENFNKISCPLNEDYKSFSII